MDLCAIQVYRLKKCKEYKSWDTKVQLYSRYSNCFEQLKTITIYIIFLPLYRIFLHLWLDHNRQANHHIFCLVCTCRSKMLLLSLLLSLSLQHWDQDIYILNIPHSNWDFQWNLEDNNLHHPNCNQHCYLHHHTIRRPCHLVFRKNLEGLWLL